VTSSQTYAFNPSFSDVILSAYARIGVRRTALVAEHLTDAYNEGNYLLAQISNLQPLLWESVELSQVLTEGVATYILPAKTVMLLLVTIQTGSGTSTNDRVIGPLSTVEYASIPNKTTQAPPTSYWFNRQITPEITFWQVPDGNGPYTAKMRAVTQVQDAVVASGATLDLPYRALDFFVAGLSHRLARIYKPELELQRKQDAMDAWSIFSGNDVENVPMMIAPMLGSYYR
jgi:hypothetical protein